MGVAQSKADILNQVLNEASIQVMNKISNSAQSSNYQENSTILGGKTTITNSDLSQSNVSTFDVTAITASVASGNLQSELAAAITQAIAQQASPLGYAANEANVKNIVQNKINVAVTNNTVSTALTSSVQKNITQSLADSEIDIINSNLSKSNKSDAVIKLISNMNSDIIIQMTNSGVIKDDLSQKITNPISDIVNAPNLIILVIIGAIIFGVTMFKQQVSAIWTEIPYVIKVGIFIGLLGLLGYFIYKMYNASSKPSGSFNMYNNSIVPHSTTKSKFGKFVNFNNYGMHHPSYPS